MIRNYILSLILYIESSIALYFSYIYFLNLINNLLYSTINYDILFFLSISLLSFLITFYLGTYFSMKIKNKAFYLIIGIIYYIVGLILFHNFINLYITISLFFIIKIIEREYSFFAMIIYFLSILFIVLKNPIFFNIVSQFIHNKLENLYISNINDLYQIYEYQLLNTYIGGYETAIYVLENEGDTNGAYILYNNLTYVNQTFFNSLNSTINGYLNQYNQTINYELDNIINNFSPEINISIALFLITLFRIFLEINKKVEDL
ncbi:putative membrane protein [Candidatus Nanobsidianus stetteri]|uniref:Putative membrane protein n=1 Tax=Nanobsidianus stetteri TaxID=1294122 RepID=R1E4G1_NANST|nr:putative membrane protein [Candidatus Nanobsidianus stetteri]